MAVETFPVQTTGNGRADYSQGAALQVKTNGTVELVDSAHPVPVDVTPGSKIPTTILDLAAIAAATISRLSDCIAVSLLITPMTFSMTVKARYNAAAVAGIRVHARTSTTNQAAGTHTAANHPTVMTDATAHFIVGELVGLTINNITDGSSGVITANTETTVTVAALAGGINNRWTTLDVYVIPGADYDTVDWDTWNVAFAAGLPVRETDDYDMSPIYVKFLIENLDVAQPVTDVQVIASTGGP